MPVRSTIWSAADALLDALEAHEMLRAHAHCELLAEYASCAGFRRVVTAANDLLPLLREVPAVPTAGRDYLVATLAYLVQVDVPENDC
jgi:hypothetical protein